METRYRYMCEAGHYFSAPRQLVECPACVRGERCRGEIWPVGLRGGRKRVVG